MLQAALDGRRNTFGAHHQSTLYTWVTLAENHQKAGRLNEAVQMFRVAVEQASQHLSPTDHALFQGLLALALIEHQQPQRAQNLLKQCLPVLEQNNHGLAPSLRQSYEAL